jgi:uncharacterized protein (DUF1697 family)
LRGVNVGTAKRVAMADLRALLESLGYGAVGTMLNSGNAFFTAGGTEEDIAVGIEGAIRAEMGIDVPVLVRSSTELARVVTGNPFIAEGVDPRQLAVSFLGGEPATEAWSRLRTDDDVPDRYERGDRALYLVRPNGVMASALPDFTKVLGVTVTERNWSTVTKLAALAGE